MATWKRSPGPKGLRTPPGQFLEAMEPSGLAVGEVMPCWPACL